MIVDSHAYTFEPADRPAGHSSSDEHLKWIQAWHARHHQPAWRVRDRSPASSEVLDPEGGMDLSSLPDVRFRVDDVRGRVVWTVDGEDYTKQAFPPALRDLEFSPHSLIGEMDYAGVDMALIHTDPTLGKDVEYLAECVRLYPDRLRSMAPVDEWRLLSDTDAVIERLTDAINRQGLDAIKFMTGLAYINGPGPWDDEPYRPFWQAVTSLNVPVFFTLGLGPAIGPGAAVVDQRAGYLGELRILMRWMERYPDIICSLTHGFPWRVFLEGNRIALPEEIWKPFQNANCSIEVCFPVRLGDLFDFPYREVWATLERMVERVGSDHLLWGTDMPFQNRFCTYRQSRDWIEKYCHFLSSEDIAMIMGGTAARILAL